MGLGILFLIPRRMFKAKKMSGYGVKLSAHHDWPQPARRSEDAATILSS
jgi:hypothetical protein